MKIYELNRGDKFEISGLEGFTFQFEKMDGVYARVYILEIPADANYMVGQLQLFSCGTQVVRR